MKRDRKLKVRVNDAVLDIAFEKYLKKNQEIETPSYADLINDLLTEYLKY